MNQRQVAGMWAWIFAAAVAAASCGRTNEAAKLTELQRLRSDRLDVVLLSPRDGLRHGKDAFIVEFRSTANGNLVDVGNVRGSATMPMPGAPMFGQIEVRRTDVPGRYAADASFEMAGTWRMALEWDGPAGHASVNFAGTVQ